MKAYIKGVEYCLPERVVSNQELVAEFPEWTVEKIAEKVGVNDRHVASEDETASDLAVKAARKLFDSYPDINPEKVDFLIFCTQSPDYFLPSSACIIQDKLGLSKKCGAFDFNLGCSGYIYGLAIAKGLISAGIAKNILLLTGETYNKFLHPRDKGNRTIFGDAATASLISTEGFAEIMDFALGTDGSGAENLIVRNGCARNPKKSDSVLFDENGNPHSDDHLLMNGAEIFTFTLKEVPAVVKEVLDKNEMTKDDIDRFVFHQANSYMLNFLRRKLKIDEDKFYVNMAEIGNTVSNTIPIALAQLKESDALHGNLLLCGFGVGYSWGACIIKANS